jgi:DNA-binding transcriptional MerR regulator
MNGKPVSKEEILKIKHLRKIGHSLPEIRSIVKRGNSVVFKYIQGVSVLPQYQSLLREKQGGSKKRSVALWKEAREKVNSISFPFYKEGLILFTTALYWAEGAKRDLSLTNSDPDLIRIFIQGLLKLGVKKSDLRVSLRLYGDIKESKARSFWAEKLDISQELIRNINWIHGKKEGKLPYGMCRVRVTKSGNYFKMIMSSIEYIKKVW